MTKSNPIVQMDPKHRAFALALEELSRQHGVAVEGCGCCGSPYLVALEDVQAPNAGYTIDPDSPSQQLRWVNQASKHYWPNDTEVFVRDTEAQV